MKKARLRKILIVLIVAVAVLMSLSISGYAATKMMDEAVISTYNSLGSDAGIYQVAVNCYMDANKTLDTSIANTRIYYGKGETLKVRFSFSRGIASGSNLRLGLKFGDEAERVVENPEVKGSYVTFSYNIQEDDYFGGLALTFIEGSVTDTSGNRILLGLQGRENTWTNTIIAKGSWNKMRISHKQIKFPNNEINGDRIINKLQGGAYILGDDGKIRKMLTSDVFILNTTDGTYTRGNDSNIEIQYATEGTKDAVDSVSPKDGSSVIFIDKVCDIAGNVSGAYNDKWSYILPGDGNLVNGKYYYKAGKIVKFLSIGIVPVTTFNIGGMTRTATVESKLLSTGEDDDNIYISTYTIQNGDNGEISNGSGNYIADTEAPTINFEGISLTSGTACYSTTIGTGNNTDSVPLAVNENKTSGTIWLRKGANINFSYSANDNIGIDPTSSTEMKVDTISQEGSYNPTRNISDYAGNVVCFALRNYITVLCDETGPNININPNTGSQKQDAIDFTIIPTDPNINGTIYRGSGVQAGENYKVVDVSNVMVSNGTIIGSSTDGNNLNIRVMPNSDGYVSVYVPAEVTTDNLGNLSQESKIAKVYVDRKAPVINDITGVPTDWTQEATLSVIASDEGVGGIQYSFDGGKTYTGNNTCNVTSNGNIQIVVKDSLGNTSEVKTVSITKIDNAAPTISGVDYHQGWTNQDVEVTINAQDSQSGIAAYSFDGGSSWQESPKKTFTSATTIAANKIKVKDRTGKETPYGAQVNIQIDKTAPTINKVTISPETSTDGEVTITVEAGDEKNGSGLAGYSFEGKAYATTNTYKVSRNGDVTISVKDNAGNETSIVKTIENITNMKPMIKLSNNGGEYAIRTGADKVKVNTTIEVDAQHDCTIYYAISQSKTTEPTNYSNIKGNKVELSLDMAQGTWYLWTYAIDNTSNFPSAKYVSEAFTASPAIVFDTSEGSCIRKVETINGVSYVIVPVNTTANDLLERITSPCNVTIKMSDSNKEVAGDSNLATNEMIVIDSINEQHRIVVKGDLTGDGIVDIRDLTQINRYRINKATLDKAEFLAGDLVEDGKVDILDLTKLNQYRLNPKIEL